MFGKSFIQEVSYLEPFGFGVNYSNLGLLVSDQRHSAVDARAAKIKASVRTAIQRIASILTL